MSSVPNSPSGSDSSVSDKSFSVDQIVTREPMFYVLSQFLEGTSGSNLVDVLETIATELKNIRKVLQRSDAPAKKQVTQPQQPPQK